MMLSLLLLLVSVLAFAGSTIAYFSDVKQTANTFTAGNVSIVLSESAITRDNAGNVIADTSKPRVLGTAEGTLHNYGIVYPGQVICKDPTVRNCGSGDAWVAVKVTLTDGEGDICKVMGYDPDETDMIDIETMLSGGLLDEKVHVGTWNGIENVCHNERYAMVQVASRANDTYDFYFFMLSPVAKGDSFTVFDTMIIDEIWDNDEMKELSDFKINVCAYAVQLYSFDSCFDAMTTAFGSEFSFN